MQFWKQIKKTPSGRGKTTIPEGASISMKKPLNISGLRYWSIRESNPWPQQCECCALPTALIPHILLFREAGPSASLMETTGLEPMTSR